MEENFNLVETSRAYDEKMEHVVRALSELFVFILYKQNL